MNKKIFVDAFYPNKVRIAITNKDLKLEELEIDDGNNSKFLRGNIYLAKIVRVEHSLQAAFVDYGGEKNGFLPFSEIHPDYYQIPATDKAKLLAEIESEKQEHLRKMEAEEARQAQEDGEEGSGEASENNVEASDEQDQERENVEMVGQPRKSRHNPDDNYLNDKMFSLYRRYNIQEVIKRGQKILVQVSKEERGNKGVSLTTYISLAGKFCVLMPNSPKSSGISRKISSPNERRRIRKIINSLNVPNEIGIVIRTAGAKQDDEAIRCDYTYLSDLWNSIREKTLSSVAPAFVCAEDDTLKRVIRDYYDINNSSIVVDGFEAYKQLKDLAQQVIPNHEARISLHSSNTPLFHAAGIERQIEDLYNNKVELGTGAYIIIDQTEALVAIDVNSGRSTQERNIEETAIKTNLDAAREIARQLRLRGLAGLIVVDFIDMMEGKNRRHVERAFIEALSQDKAKIQVDRISQFGLLSLSRQRLHTSFLEAQGVYCSSCGGAGITKSLSNMALLIFQEIRSFVGDSSKIQQINAIGSQEVVNYILNFKRATIAMLEKSCNVKIHFIADTNLQYAQFKLAAKDIDTESEDYLQAIEAVSAAEVTDMESLSENKISHAYRGRSNQERSNYSNNRRSQERDDRRPFSSSRLEKRPSTRQPRYEESENFSEAGGAAEAKQEDERRLPRRRPSQRQDEGFDGYRGRRGGQRSGGYERDRRDSGDRRDDVQKDDRESREEGRGAMVSGIAGGTAGGSEEGMGGSAGGSIGGSMGGRDTRRSRNPRHQRGRQSGGEEAYRPNESSRSDNHEERNSSRRPQPESASAAGDETDENSLLKKIWSKISG